MDSVSITMQNDPATGETRTIAEFAGERLVLRGHWSMDLLKGLMDEDDEATKWNIVKANYDLLPQWHLV